MDLWNVKNLEPPAASSCKLHNHDINLPEVNGLLKDSLNLFSDQIFLDAESKLLRTIVKLNKLKYRTIVGYKNVQKLNRCVRSYDEFDYKGLIAWFNALLPSRYEADTYFPSRNMLDYVLVRTQGLGKLCVRLLECARQVYIHWMAHVNRGHNMGVAIIIIAVQARLFTIFSYLLQCTCHLYDSLAALRPKVPNTMSAWLPAGYPLPGKLLAWLEAEWVFKEHTLELEGSRRTLLARTVFDEEDVEFCQEYHIIEDDEDLQIVNEYLNIPDSDEEEVASPVSRVKVEEIDAELAVVTEQVKNTIGVIMGSTVIPKAEVKQEAIAPVEVTQEVIAPVEVTQEVIDPVEVTQEVIDPLEEMLAELYERVKTINSLGGLYGFIQEGSDDCFRSMGVLRYNHLLSTLQVQKEIGKSMERKSQRRELQRKMKQMVMQYVRLDALDKSKQK